MNILILGAGEIGSHLAAHFSRSGSNVTVIESDPAVAAEISESMDVRVVIGNGASVEILEEAGVAGCDVFMGVGNRDDTNVVAASVARALGARKGLARVHARLQREQWLFDYRTHFGIDYLFSPERLAAVELAKFIRNPGAIIVEELAGGRVELQQVAVEPGSPAADTSLKDLKFPGRVRVGLIDRNGHTLIPAGSDILREKDVVTLFGTPARIDEAARIFRRRSRNSDAVRVAILGGGGYGFSLAQMLEGGRFQTRIFEKNREVCLRLAGMLTHAKMIHADGTSSRHLKEEQVGACDFFVGATSNDEDNVMACLQARELGVRTCLALVHRADYAETITRSGERTGIAAAVSPREATLRDLRRFVAEGQSTTLLRLGPDGAGARVIEFVVSADSPLAGRSVRQTQWPPGCGLVAVTQRSSTAVPAADDVLDAGNRVIALVAEESLAAFHRLIG